MLFINAIIKKIERMTFATVSRFSNRPGKSKNIIIAFPGNTNIQAAKNCPTAFLYGTSETTSSLIPIKNKITIPAMALFSSYGRFSPEKIITGRMMPANTIVPPKRGTGWSCEVRSPGILYKFFDFAILITDGMPTIVINKETRKQKRLTNQKGISTEKSAVLKIILKRI